MADVQHELAAYAARRQGGTSPRAQALVSTAARLYTQTLKDLRRFGGTSKRFWSTLNVRPALIAAQRGDPATRHHCTAPHLYLAAHSHPAQALASSLEAIMNVLQGDQDYYLCSQQWGELVLPALRAVCRCPNAAILAYQMALVRPGWCGARESGSSDMRLRRLVACSNATHVMPAAPALPICHPPPHSHTRCVTWSSTPIARRSARRSSVREQRSWAASWPWLSGEQCMGPTCACWPSMHSPR